MEKRKTVCYEDFGAVGDGKTDDYAAIVRTHDIANECGQTVKATPGARYYIFDNIFMKDGAKKETLNIAFIQTNVDWGDAEFIIDDTKLHFKSSEENYGMNASIFRVIPDDSLSKITIKDPAILQRLVAEGINVYVYEGDTLPEDYICPLCKHPASDFEEIK